jgi:hypothetical protein
MNLIDFLQDYRWIVLIVCLPLLVIYGRVLVKAALGGGSTSKPTLTRPPTVPLRKLPPKPGSQIKPPSNSNLIKGPALPPEGRQEVLPNSTGAGLAEHQKASVAKTVKLPNVTPKPTDAPTAKSAKDSINEEMDGLFGPRDEVPTVANKPINDEAKTAKEDTPEIPKESDASAIRRKASRLQELGFHHSIATDQLKDAPAGTTSGTSLAIPASTPIAGTPEAPRSSTAELTSILERIDKFLAEDTPDSATAVSTEKKETSTIAKNHTPAASEAPSAQTNTSENKAQAKTQPMWARADVTDDDLGDETKTKIDADKKTDSGQQRLF